MRITFALLAATVWAQAQPPPQSVEWSRTPVALAGKFALVKLTGGIRLGGTWVSVTPDSFAMNVESTSKSQEIPKGLRSIPRSSFTELKVRKRRARGRVIGTLAGLTAGSALAGLVSGSREGAQGPAGFAVLGLATAGYYVGREMDYATQVILLVPDPSGPSLPK